MPTRSKPPRGRVVVLGATALKICDYDPERGTVLLRNADAVATNTARIGGPQVGTGTTNTDTGGGVQIAGAGGTAAIDSPAASSELWAIAMAGTPALEITEVFYPPGLIVPNTKVIRA